MTKLLYLGVAIIALAQFSSPSFAMEEGITKKSSAPKRRNFNLASPKESETQTSASSTTKNSEMDLTR